MHNSNVVNADTLRNAVNAPTVESPAPSGYELAISMVVQHLITRINAVLAARMARLARGELLTPYPQVDASGRPITSIGIGLDPLRAPIANLAKNTEHFELRSLVDALFGTRRELTGRCGLARIRIALQRALDERRAGFAVLGLTTGYYPGHTAKTLVVTLHDPLFVEEHPQIAASIPRRRPLGRRPAERTQIHDPGLITTTELQAPSWLDFQPP